MSNQNKINNQKIVKDVKSNHLDFKNNYLLFFLFISLFLFSFSVFKNIQFPLFWADESMTVVGSERVLEFGYPKVHDGKNVFYDLRHTNPTLGIDTKTDAYIGGTGWGHYYYGIIGVKLAQFTDDLYIKTGIIRSTFAFIGIIGLVIFVWLSSSIFKNIQTKLLYASGFFLVSILSISLALLLREVRYYSLAIFLFSVVTGTYIKFRLGNGFNNLILRIILILGLVVMFFTFAPVYFILIVSLVLFELLIIIVNLYKKNEPKKILLIVEPVISSIFISFLIIFPFLDYFKTFEISAAMAIFNNYSKQMFWNNVATVLKYFRNFELLWLAIVIKIIFVLNYKKIAKTNFNLILFSIFTMLLFLIYTFAISRIPNFIYSRYIVLLIPILISSILFDTLAILFSDENEKMKINSKLYLLIILFIVFVFGSIFVNNKSIKGHITELFEPYKGPLDYSIPYIIEKFKKTDTLVIAANYEETSYMYYLKSKVIVGFIGNNLEEDSKLKPHIIAYRKPWGNFGDIFQNYFIKNQYAVIAFPIYDNPVNNIPELNFMPAFNHQFKTKLTSNEQEQTNLYFIK